jgi:serine/threonine-protein kinase
MGRVYTAEQQMGSTVRKVAIKTLLEEFSKDPDVVERFMRECGTVSELEHPNTIRFYDFGRTDNDDLYIAMEMVDGAPLTDVIERAGAMAADRVVKVMRQVCGSLQEAHDKGIVHRDLKPDNIILATRAGETDFAKVLDFGIAKRNDAADNEKEKKLTQVGMVLGTPPYMSPEQFTGKELDGRSDIYSLGVITYEMLTGKLPFEANTPWEWATQHMREQPTPFALTAPMAAQIPDGIKQAVMRALSKNRDDRQATAKMFCDELASGAAGAAAAGVGPTQAFPSSQMPAAGAGSSRPGGTQIGEPFVPPAAAASEPAAGYSAAGQVSTGGGQAIPAPPPQMRGGGGGKLGLIIGAAAVAALLVVGIVFAVGAGGGDDDETGGPIIDVSATSAQPVTTSDPPDDDEATTTGSAGGAATSATADPTDTAPPPPPPPPPRTSTVPPPPPKDGTASCNVAIGAALAGRCRQARAALRNCSGWRKSAATANVRGCKKK